MWNTYITGALKSKLREAGKSALRIRYFMPKTNEFFEIHLLYIFRTYYGCQVFFLFMNYFLNYTEFLAAISWRQWLMSMSVMKKLIWMKGWWHRLSSEIFCVCYLDNMFIYLREIHCPSFLYLYGWLSWAKSWLCSAPTEDFLCALWCFPGG